MFNLESLKYKKFFVPLVVFGSLVVGVFSAWLEMFFNDLFNREGFIFFGLFFGVVTLPWFLLFLGKQFSEKKYILTSIAWAVASFLSFYSAFNLATFLFNIQDCLQVFGYCLSPVDLCITIAGVLGAFIVAVAFHILFRKLNGFLFFLLCFVGGVIPLCFWNKDFNLFFFESWQGVVSAILGYAAVRKKTQG